MTQYYSFAHSVLGYSHIASGKVCQDYSLHFCGDNAAVVVVSDGHGSANFTRSDRGSRFACEETLNAVTEFLEIVDPEQLDDIRVRDEIVLQLCKNIVLRWNQRVDLDFAAEPFTEREVEGVSDRYRDRYLNGQRYEHAYGATLIVAIVTKDYFLAIRNGDGQCVTVDHQGMFATPIPWNEDCEFNVTTSLCDENTIAAFRYCYSKDLPAAVFIGSDGVDDSYTSVEELYHLYRSICLKAVAEGPTEADRYIAELLPGITKRGSQDDVSVAGLLDASSLYGARETMEAIREERRLRMEQAQLDRKKQMLMRDIKMAQKQLDKATSRRREVQKALGGNRSHQRNLLEQISEFTKKFNLFKEKCKLLEEEEESLDKTVEEAEEEIRVLQERLLTLEEPTESAATPETQIDETAVEEEDCGWSDAAVGAEAEELQQPQETEEDFDWGDEENQDQNDTE